MPATVVVVAEGTGKRNSMTAQPGKDAVFKLAAGKYRVLVHCSLYEAAGPDIRDHQRRAQPQPGLCVPSADDPRERGHLPVWVCVLSNAQVPGHR